MEKVIFELHHEGRVRVCQIKKGRNILGRENTAFKDSKNMKELNVFCVQ